MASPSGGSDDGLLFEGVRFVLASFDPATESQYRSARRHRHREARQRVLWVDESLDRGVLADADRVPYWPVREYNGIPENGFFDGGTILQTIARKFSYSSYLL